MNFKALKSTSILNSNPIDSFVHNSLFIMLSSISGAGFGFIFWMLAAKYYSPENVGIATALISAMGLLVLLSKLGIDFSIISFFPIKDKSELFSTSIIVTTIAVILLGLIFIFGIDIFSPELSILKNPVNIIIFLIVLSINSITTFSGISFIALRKAKYHSIQSMINGFRILFLIILIGGGAMSIFNSIGLSFFISLIFSFFFLKRSGIEIKFTIDFTFLKESFHFSAGNYFINMFMVGSTTILPILTLNTLGAENAAYYFISYSIASLLYMIPNSAGLSLFVEGSNGESMKKTAIKSMTIIYLLLIPSILILYFFGGIILKVISIEYSAKCIELLQLIVLSYLFQGVNHTYFAIRRIQKKIFNLTILTGLYFILILGLSYIFMLMFGLNGIGYAWIASNGILFLLIGLNVWKEGWFEHIFEKNTLLFKKVY
jgi:O-antigen/teichoic acid export membrane protein